MNSRLWEPAARDYEISPYELFRAMEGPLITESISSPVEIESIELLHLPDATVYSHGIFLLRTRSTSGAEGYALPNPRIRELYPLLFRRVVPYFIGRDARSIEELVEGVYTYRSNYKLSGLALWNCVAWVEFSILDLLGRVTGKTVGDLFGGIVRRSFPVYYASYNRDTTPREEVAFLQKRVEEHGVRAVKIRLGGRMSNDADAMPGRTENLIPMTREGLGDAVDIHADANGSYNPPKAIEVAAMLEGIGAVFFEEPCPFDHLEETREVNLSVGIPIACGEQETSMRRFRWLIENRALRVVQPDLEYNGGFLRATRIARMAERAGMPITPHISGSFAFLYTSGFASYTPNLGQYQEYNGVAKVNALLGTSFAVEDGALNIPNGPGLGLGDVEDLAMEADPVKPVLL